MAEYGEDWLTVLEAARYAGVSAAAIRKRIRVGRLEARKRGAQFFVSRASLDAYQRLPPGPPKRDRRG